MAPRVFHDDIDAQKLRRLSSTLVNHQRLEAPTWNRRDAPLGGYMKVAKLQPGMRLRLADVQDRVGLTSHAELPAGIKIAMVIEGAARVRYGGFETRLGPEAASTGLVVALPAAADFTRLGRAGGHERTLTLGLTPRWLARHGLAGLLQAGSDAPRLTRWTPSRALLMQAARLFSPDTMGSDHPAQQLRLTGFALLLVGEALAGEAMMEEVLPGEAHAEIALAPATPREEAAPRRREDRHLRRLLQLVNSGQARGATQSELADRLGLSLSSLQRRFRAWHGEPLGHFLRRCHLSAARDVLVGEATGIDAAAALAGYNSAANFATAFKREFGITPSECRAAAQDDPACARRR